MALLVSTCVGCGQEDDHPKHLVGLPDGSDVRWHNDCHSRSANGCDTCSANAAQGLKGEELRTHIEENRPFATLMDEEGVING